MKAVRSLAVAVLGLIVPFALLFLAATNLSSLSGRITDTFGRESPRETLASLRPILATGNDYMLFALMSSERANEAVVINKQVMKVVVMQVGFAVASVGLMFIALGINDGGAEGNVGGGQLSFNFKTGSTGALIFVVGAAMSAAGGLLRNEYNTVPIPGFAFIPGEAQKNGDTGDGGKFADAEARLDTCKTAAPNDVDRCFLTDFEALAGEK